ncbi:MFS transporter [Arachidicoccus terrestris]|uniref:MFS transporter n=1 Tax=Arachidicoccus terrestris TaxID=2875539 RepID=UPI001CC6F510|nr:MFS transporter [Arachidicoccus terrestris]UAY56168.1 MFS transporter [Arachidicoccus terrestris]
MENKRLLTLTLGGLSIGTTEFVMMGMLPEVARDFSISIPEAGHFIAAYALGVVIGAPLFAIIGSKYPPKKLLLILMAIFTLFNGLTALSTGHTMMVITRLMSGLPHGAFFGVGSVVAAKLAAKGKEAAAMSIMFAGLTVANIVMVPLGTYIGLHFSWRYVFGMIALLGLLTVIFIAKVLPALPANTSGSIDKELGIFKRPVVWIMILITAIGTGGLFAWISYIAPMLTSITHFKETAVPYVMIVAGLGMFIGNILGGKLADKLAPANALLIALMAVGSSLLLDYFFAANQTLTLVGTFLTGASSFALIAPIQILMIRIASEAEILGASATQAAFNIGNAIGAFAGGLPIAAGFGYSSPILIGVLMVLIGIGLTMILIQMQQRQQVCAV